jgi:TonB family protein
MRFWKSSLIYPAALAVVVMVIPVLGNDAPLQLMREDALRAAIGKVTPDYSMMAKQLKLKGVVEVEVLINEGGAVDAVLSVSGNPVLFNCVREAVMRWKFTPFKSDGKPVKAKTSLLFHFDM